MDDGQNEECIKKLNTIQEFIIYKSKSYYINYVEDVYCLERIDIDGGSTKIISKGHNSGCMNGLQADSDYVYFNDENIYKIDISSGERSTVLENVAMECISSGYIYYKDYDHSGLNRMNISDESTTCIVEDKQVIGVNIYGGYIILAVNCYDEDNPDENTAKYICRLNWDELTEIKKYMTM